MSMPQQRQHSPRNKPLASRDDPHAARRQGDALYRLAFKYTPTQVRNDTSKVETNSKLLSEHSLTRLNP